MEIIHAELLPEDKVHLIDNLKKREGPAAMVGDGVNDAPALAMASIGISMGVSGSAVAVETSHITLMSNDLRKIPKAIRLARKTRFKIVANIVFSLATKIAILAMAVAGHPLLWAAVLADVGTCLLVIFNSMTLLQTSKPSQAKCCSSSHNRLKERRLQSPSFQGEHCCHDHKKAIAVTDANHTSDGCRMANGDEFGRERGCSSAEGTTGRREIGGCCRSHRDGYCAGESAVVQMPEIITEWEREKTAAT